MSKDFSEVFKEKKEARKIFFKQHKIPKNTRAIIVNLLENPQLKKSITDACNSVDVYVFENIENIDFFAVDAIIVDKLDLSIVKNISNNLIVPISLKGKNTILSEFNPMKFEGNSFLFEKMEIFSIFEKIGRMLENSQYAGDKRMLLKNIFSLNNPV